MRINLTSVPDNDQDRALRFYTKVLGFTVKHDVPLGAHLWITVVSPEDRTAPNSSLSPTPTPPPSRSRTR